MNNWECPRCGVINNDQTTMACCMNCGSSKWVTMPTVAEPQNGTYFETKSACPDCARLTAELVITKTVLQSGVKMISQLYDDYARLKTLLADVWQYLQPQPDGTHYRGHYELLEKRVKQEGI